MLGQEFEADAESRHWMGKGPCPWGSEVAPKRLVLLPDTMAEMQSSVDLFPTFLNVGKAKKHKKTTRQRYCNKAGLSTTSNTIQNC